MTVDYQGPAFLRPYVEAAGLQYLNRAKFLALAGTAFDDQHLAAICRLRNLESLTLSNTRISRRGLELVERSIPQCKIYDGGKLLNADPDDPAGNALADSWQVNAR